MRVIAVDGGEEKRKLCIDLGAEAYLDFLTTKDIPTEVKKLTTYGAQAVLVTASSKSAYDTAPSMLRPGGTVVVVGLPSGDCIVGAHPGRMVSFRLNIVGSVVGTLKDVEEALDFTARGLVTVGELIRNFWSRTDEHQPIVTKGKLENIDEYIQKLKKGQLAGRAVLEVT